MSELCYSSNMFLVAKKLGGKRPVLKLRPLNNFVPNETFKMEGIHLLKDFLKPNYFMTKLDVRDTYCSIPIDEQSRHYLQFIFERKLYQFKVLVFGLSTAPRSFTKVTGFLLRGGGTPKMTFVPLKFSKNNRKNNRNNNLLFSNCCLPPLKFFLAESQGHETSCCIYSSQGHFNYYLLPTFEECNRNTLL